MTLNYLGRRNDGVVCVISLNSVPFLAYYVKVVKDTPIHSASKMAIFAGNHQRGR